MQDFQGQALQDAFAFDICNTLNGTFIEFGSGDGIKINNTFVLEQKGWRGLLIEADAKYERDLAQMRKSPFVIAEAQKLDWNYLMSKHQFLNSPVDFISFDVDDANRVVFDNFPWEKIRFRSMTLEHDCYRLGNSFRDYSRQRLSRLGYKLIAQDVRHRGNSFEDWWVCAELEDHAIKYKSQNQEFPDFMRLLKPNV